MVEDLGKVSLGSGRSRICLKVSTSSAYCEGQTYLPPCGRLGLCYPVDVQAQKEIIRSSSLLVLQGSDAFCVLISVLDFNLLFSVKFAQILHGD